jgi:hypothetical protein
MCPDRIREEVSALVGSGRGAELVEANGQCYALIKGVEAPSPPWSKSGFDILIPVPAAYDAAELDGFYLELPYAYNGGEHSRIKGDVIEVASRKWRQVSWHYPEGKAWLRGRDNLETHVVHCRGFFLNRGAVNAP